MKYLVIGTFIRDKIITLSGAEFHSLGGLCHTLSPLLACANPEDQILPVCYVGTDLRKEVEQFLSTSVNVSGHELRFINQPNNKVCLEYYNDGERIERSLYPLPSLPYGMIEPGLDADVIIINMISGWELSLDVLKKIRANFKNKIILDLHSLSLGRKEDGTRFYRPIPDFREWFQQCDILQMNDREFHNLGGRFSNMRSFVNENVSKTQMVINITRGYKGSLTIIRNHQYFELVRTAPDKNINVVDPTGCGDVFLGTFAMTYVQTLDMRQAARKANLLAAISGTCNGFATPAYLKEKLDNYQESG